MQKITSLSKSVILKKISELKAMCPDFTDDLNYMYSRYKYKETDDIYNTMEDTTKAQRTYLFKAITIIHRRIYKEYDSFMDVLYDNIDFLDVNKKDEIRALDLYWKSYDHLLIEGDKLDYCRNYASTYHPTFKSVIREIIYSRFIESIITSEEFKADQQELIQLINKIKHEGKQ